MNYHSLSDPIHPSTHPPIHPSTHPPIHLPMKQYTVLHFYVLNGTEHVGLHRVDTALDMTKQSTLDKLCEDMGITLSDGDQLMVQSTPEEPYILD